jgi:hypothetical protein
LNKLVVCSTPTGKRSIDNITGFIVDFGVRRCGKRVEKIEQACVTT